MDNKFLKENYVIDLNEFKKVLNERDIRYKIVILSINEREEIYFLMGEKFVKAEYNYGPLHILFRYLSADKKIRKSIWHNKVEEMTKNIDERYTQEEFFDMLSSLENFDIYLYQLNWID